MLSHGVMWCGVVWCGVVWCGVVWCGVVWCGVVWCGVVWCGVVWCGVVWCGVVWCGVVFYCRCQCHSLQVTIGNKAETIIITGSLRAFQLLVSDIYRRCMFCKPL